MPFDSTRRSFMSGLAAATVSSSFALYPQAVKNAVAKTISIEKAELVDVHHHFIPPFYAAEHHDHIATVAGGRIHPAYLNWSVEQAIEAMDQNGVGTAILSLTTPGIWFGGAEAAAQLARKVNEYAAELVSSRPRRFGLFAAIPLPHTESSLDEINYAFGALKADGIGIMSSYDDKWLGDPLYEPVFEELNRRRAVVFVHPTTGVCCRMLLPDVNPIMLEIPQDTTRAITNLLFSGSLTKFKDIRFIFAHGGGTVPMIIGRMHQYAPKNVTENLPNGIEYELQRLYYDVAGTAYRPAIAALTSLVASSQILFGSDHPFIPLAETAQGISRLGLSAADLHSIGRANAMAVIPSLKKRWELKNNDDRT